MNFVQILDVACDKDIYDLVSIVKFVITGICWVVPILLIVFVTIDVAHVVTAGNLDDKMKKEVGNKVVTRLIYALIIFLIPTLVSLLFRLLGNNTVINGTSSSATGCSWSEAWNQNLKTK